MKNRTMNIKFNALEKSIEIKDGLKTQYLMIKIILFITLLNSILLLFLFWPKRNRNGCALFG
jgi:hypothetical protein